MAPCIIASLAGGGAADGGGTCDAILKNCTLAGDSANNGGGAWRGALDEAASSITTPVTQATPTTEEGRSSLVAPRRCPPAPADPDQCALVPEHQRLERSAPGPRLPIIDAGADLSAFIATDLAGLPRPLDGNGDGLAALEHGRLRIEHSLDPTCHMPDPVDSISPSEANRAAPSALRRASTCSAGNPSPPRHFPSLVRPWSIPPPPTNPASSTAPSVCHSARPHTSRERPGVRALQRRFALLPPYRPLNSEACRRYFRQDGFVFPQLSSS